MATHREGGMSRYLEMRRAAVILRDEGDYSLAKSEMNPVIFEDFVGLLSGRDLPASIWEPFAGQTDHSGFQDFSESIGFKMISQTLNPKDPRIRKGDSTVSGPGEDVGGMIFHPPYFGSNPLSDDERDIVATLDREEYLESLRQVVNLTLPNLVSGAFVCAVGRDYRIGGERIHLDQWYFDVFGSASFCLHAVWTSEPDVVLILRRRNRS